MYVYFRMIIDVSYWYTTISPPLCTFRRGWLLMWYVDFNNTFVLFLCDTHHKGNHFIVKCNRKSKFYHKKFTLNYLPFVAVCVNKARAGAISRAEAQLILWFYPLDIHWLPLVRFTISKKLAATHMLLVFRMRKMG